MNVNVGNSQETRNRLASLERRVIRKTIEQQNKMAGGTPGAKWFSRNGERAEGKGGRASTK